MKLLKLLSFIFIALIFTACPIKNERLPKQVVPLNLPELPLSILQIPLTIKSQDLKEAFYQQFPNPVLKGETEALKMKLSGKQKEGDQNLWDRITSPLLKWVDKTFHVSSKVLYEVNLSNFDFWFDGDQFYMDVLLDLETQVDLKNRITILGEHAKLEGSLNCPMQARVVMNGRIELTSNAQINVLLDDDNGRIKFQKICSSKAIKEVDFPQLLRPILEPLKKHINQSVNKIITQQLQRLLSNSIQSDYLSFQEKINTVAQQLGQPYHLAENIWLIPRVQQVFVSPLNGSGKGVDNQLQFCIGAKAKPMVALSETKPQESIPKTVDFAVENYQTRTSIYVNGTVPLDYAARELQVFLKNYVDQNYAKHGYTIGKVRIYPSAKKAAVAIEVLKAKTTKQKAMLYLSGLPKYDAHSQEVYLDDLAFTTQSKNIILKFADWILHPKIMKALKENARFGLSDSLKDLQAQINDFKLEEQIGTLTGKFDYVDINQVFIGEKNFEVYLQAEGKLDFEIHW
ncbi:DUF4403 family protein [Aureispira anguillae]|uniref:DUF4403 family protein n=1 Tax=Aureispira anguillae TaxID=2864201 RepID=A0A915YB52_9BACT|nr:DUF4403 family protein [Aureispira anguillae]BDS09839.1 DUF4403 family protein [Aureispira anguillae]